MKQEEMKLELNDQNFVVLSEDGSVVYKKLLFTQKESDQFLKKLLNTIEWKSDEAIIFGKKIITRRKVA